MTPPATANGMIGIPGSAMIGGLPGTLPSDGQSVDWGMTGIPFLTSATPGTFGSGHLGHPGL